jgi:hypothetical protein
MPMGAHIRSLRQNQPMAFIQQPQCRIRQTTFRDENGGTPGDVAFYLSNFDNS